MQTKVDIDSRLKDDPLKSQSVVLELPPGHRRVWSGAVKEDDLCLNMLKIRQDGEVEWIPVINDGQAKSKDEKRFIARHGARYFGCLIRGDGESDMEEPCERCKMHAREEKLRYCLNCAHIVRQQGRHDNKECDPLTEGITLRHIFGEGWYLTLYKDGKEVKELGPYKTRPTRAKIRTIQDREYDGREVKVWVEKSP